MNTPWVVDITVPALLSLHGYDMAGMDCCGSYHEISLSELHIDADRVRALTESWGVIITDEGKVRIPVCCYDDIRALLSRRE
ncbi:MAG: hypothetical protein LUQ50_00625 [Methanospirillum sp.]|uniref:hypothetical protein n=1 Tax=Methanospirillum sp. TaxID=45200 RepID=UPI00236FF23B|nr:hypothetical protein [Methanospirillum sp.]MDD1727556.1 hypothetical protein [Methanospirillum sp.]